MTCTRAHTCIHTHMFINKPTHMCMYVCTYLAPYYLSKISFDCQGVYAGNNNGLSLYYLIHTLPTIYFRQVIGYQICTNIHMDVCLCTCVCMHVHTQVICT